MVQKISISSVPSTAGNIKTVAGFAGLGPVKLTVLIAKTDNSRCHPEGVGDWKTDFLSDITSYSAVGCSTCLDIAWDLTCFWYFFCFSTGAKVLLYFDHRETSKGDNRLWQQKNYRLNQTLAQPC